MEELGKMGKRCDKSIHIIEIKEDNEGYENAHTRTPQCGEENKEKHENSPPWLKIEGRQLLVVGTFHEGTVVDNDDDAEKDEESTEDTICSSMKCEPGHDSILVLDRKSSHFLSRDSNRVFTEDALYKPTSSNALFLHHTG